MGDIYSCCLECIAMIDCEPKLLSRLHTEKNMRKDIFDEDYYNAWKNSKSSPDYLLHCKQIYEKYSGLVEGLCAFQQNGWWNRVWTWQEMALPFGVVRLMAETDIDRVQSNTITMDDLLNSFKNAADIVLYMHSTKEDREIHVFLFDWLAEISYARAFKKHGVEMTPTYQFFTLIRSLSKSPRRCMDPVDYVYGVLGILQIKIPRMTDPQKVWQHFLYELDDYMDMAGFKNKVFQIPQGVVEYS
ncbi:hypothetical protein K492DRAFT_222136 [Lichtheimia hyalospora FSU 10163]|nr:hypothetical protein K492DRAFT_222136 [Lichtheimia hyalospora FSU 10163]